MNPRPTHCPTCPYRRDVPSGVWDATEYTKLLEYDRETGEQPVGVFMCHDAADGETVCRGWLDVHDKPELLSLRLAMMTGLCDHSIIELPVSGAAVFASGAEAASHGLREIESPQAVACKVIAKLQRRRST